MQERNKVHKHRDISHHRRLWWKTSTRM